MQRGRGPLALAGAAVCAAVMAGPAWAADEPGAYGYDEAARTVKGGATSTDGPRLPAGSTYRDSIRAGQKLYYRVDLDAKSNAYLSTVVVPGPGTKVAGDRVRVRLEDRRAGSCDTEDTGFTSSAAYPRPVTAVVARVIEKDRTSCQEAGSYYLVVEREGAPTADPGPWGLEIGHLTEPAPKAGGPTAAPSQWPSASPPPPQDGPRERHGGTGFHTATGLAQGEWTDTITPGRTLYYWVPVDWGQQLFASADLGSSAKEGAFVGGALSLRLFNPVRSLVTGKDAYYSGKQTSAALDPVPPVAYENRYNAGDSVSGMRFAGGYYLAVDLNPEVVKDYGKGPYGLTLRLTITGDAKNGPYDGPAGEFAVSDASRQAAASGQKSGQRSSGDTADSAMPVVAAAGIGTGTVLVLGLGVWTLAARRSALRSG
ncbi:hypothetical protein [Streptomyces sannanensis]